MSDRQKDRKRHAQASRMLSARVIRKTIPMKLLHLLGIESDRNLEKQFRINRRTISRLRRLLKIKTILPSRTELKWLPARLKLLGRHSDIALAKKFGVRRSRVSKMRRKLGIAVLVHRHTISSKNTFSFINWRSVTESSLT